MEYAPLAGDWLSVLPEFLLTACGALLMVSGAVFKGRSRVPAWAGVASLAFVSAFSVWFSHTDIGGGESFLGMLGPAGYTWFFCVCAMLSSVMAVRWLARSGKPRSGEFMGLLCFAAASLSLFARSGHLMMTFVALESSAVCFYALIAWLRRSLPSLEASIRYLVLSGVSGAFFLLGIAFVYGASLQGGSGLSMLYYSNFYEGADSMLFTAGIVLSLSAVFFKLSAFPFQFWAPDVYQGAPTPVAAFLAVASKGAAAIVALSMLSALGGSERLVLFLSAIAAAGIVVGNLGGLGERVTKRIIGFSGIANAGYLMVFIASAVWLLNDPANAGFVDLTLKLYMLSYMFAVYGVLFVQNLRSSESDSDLDCRGFLGLWKRMPLSAGSVAVGLASLAGIPPTAGFFAKLFVLIMAYAAGLYWLMAVLIAGSAASIFYYFKWMRACFSEGEGGEEFEYELGSGPMILALALASLCVGVMVAARALFF